MTKIHTKKQTEELLDTVTWRRMRHKDLHLIKVGESLEYSPEEVNRFSSLSTAQASINNSARVRGIKVKTKSIVKDDGIGLLVLRVE